MEISISAEGPLAVVHPRVFLGTENFDVYLDACTAAGASFDRKRKVNLIAVNELPGLVERLRKLGFETFIEKAVAASLRQRAAEHRIRVAAASAASESIAGIGLYDFQEEGAGWLRARKRGVLGDQMGLGKTPQALVAVPARVPEDEAGFQAGDQLSLPVVPDPEPWRPRVLVVCPPGLKLNWRDEARRWRPDLRVHVASGSGSFRFPKPGEIVIVGDSLLPESVSISRTPRNVYLIVDEIHRMKDLSSGRGKRLYGLAQSVRDQNGTTWGLTGSPIMNRWEELYNILCQLGLNREVFRDRRSVENMFKYQRSAVAPALRSVMLRREREEVLPDLPTKTYKEILVEDLSKEVIQSADAMMTMLKAVGALTETNAIKADFNIMGNREIASAMMRSRRLLADAKIPALVELVESYEAANEPVVVFSAHRGPVDHLGKRHGWATITGDVIGERRHAVINGFQHGKYKGVAITIAAGGVGITLTRAHTAIFVDRDWTPAGNSQAEDRLARIGQKNAVVIVNLIAKHALDIRVNEILMYKQELITATVEAAEVKSGRALSHDIQAATVLEQLATVIEGSIDPTPSIAAKAKEPRLRKHSNAKSRRQFSTGEEHWAAEAVCTLSDLDSDRARERNGAGFNKLDAPYGHKLAGLIRAGEGLTDGEWGAAVRMAKRYPRQVGRPVVESGAAGN